MDRIAEEAASCTDRAGMDSPPPIGGSRKPTSSMQGANIIIARDNAAPPPSIGSSRASGRGACPGAEQTGAVGEELPPTPILREGQDPTPRG